MTKIVVRGLWFVVSGHHNCMIPSIKTYLDKKYYFEFWWQCYNEAAFLAS